MTPSTRSRRGMNLIEILVSMALMGLCLGAIGTVFVTGYNASTAGSQTAQMFRSAAVGFDDMTRELRLCQQVYAPDLATMGAGYSPRQGLNRPLVVRRYDAKSGANQAVAFTMNDTTHVLLRIIYDPGFVAGNASTWTVSNPSQILTLSQSVQGLTFHVVVPPEGDDLIQSDLQSYPSATVFPLESTVAIMGF